jgi:hypothetical protein
MADQSSPARAYQEALLLEIREELQKADGKASILLAAAGIAMGALLTGFSAGTWSPSKLSSSWAEALVWASIVLATLGIFVLGTAVKPRLRKASTASNEGLHYFGHVASYAGHWLKSDFAKQRPAEFDAALVKASSDDNYEQRLRDQIWFLGCIAFRKYKLISVSMWVFATSLVCGGVAVLFEVTK